MSRLRGLTSTTFTSTIFTEMTELAHATGSVNLGQGFPDTDGPAAMLAVAQHAIGAGRNQYPPLNGLPELRAAIAEQRRDRYGTAYDPDAEVLVTMGATEAVAASLIALCRPGDEVILFEPYYDSYRASIAMAGAVAVPVALRPDGRRFRFDPADLRRAAGPRTRMLLLNTPHNPTGKVFADDELAEIARVCERHDVIVLADEVYEYLTYDGARHRSIAALPGLRERTLAVSSAGKTFSVTGWKIGWLCGPPDLVAAVRSAKQFLTFAGAAPFQAAVAYGLRDELDWVERLRAGLQARRDQLSAGLRRIGADAYPGEGTYFLQVDIRSLRRGDGRDFCLELAHRCGVVAIPAQAFYDDVDAGRPFVRFAFCKGDAVIDEAIRRLTKFDA
jgi:N-succinyldiaminopimelate aminotransferase